MTNAETILRALDAALDQPVELTLYGRAALVLGFDNPLEEYARSQDVDVVLWLQQAEDLAERTNFWAATDLVNQQFAEQGLYVSHLFTEDQVILRPDWRAERVALGGEWEHLTLYRLGDLDLLLSKLMRDDPIDRVDAQFIFSRAGLGAGQVAEAIQQARVPPIVELQEQFQLASQKFLEQLGLDPC